MFRRSPFPLADNRQASAVDDEMKACAPWNAPKRQVEVLATTGQRRVIRRPKVEPHQHEERREKALGLTERQMEEKTQRQGGFDREVRVLPLRAPRARSVRFPGGDGRRGQPDGDVASPDQGAIIGGPVLDVVLRLVRGMDSRLHPSSLACLSKPHTGFVHQRRLTSGSSSFHSRNCQTLGAAPAKPGGLPRAARTTRLRHSSLIDRTNRSA